MRGGYGLNHVGRSIEDALYRRLAVSAQIAAWALACIASAALVGLLQTQNRAPLTWDEATRVRAGQEFVFALRTGGLPAFWTWVNDQVFYPFVAPLLHGLVLLFVNDPVVAAWVPSLGAYMALGLLTGALAKDLDFGATAAWIAALLCWSTPLYARLAAGGFVDNLGACASVATVLLVVRSLRTGRILEAVFAGVMSVITFLIRYDYGLVLIGTLAVCTAIAAIRRRSEDNLKALIATCCTTIVLVELWFIPNSNLKWTQFSAFLLGDAKTGSALTKINLDYLIYYLGALWNNGELGLSSLVADVTLAAIVLGSLAVVRKPRLTSLLVFIAGWYVFYSAAGARSPQFARYMAAVLPFGFVLIGMSWSQATTFLRHGLVDPRLASRFGWIAMFIFGLELIHQIGGPFGWAQQFWFIQANPAAAQIVDFLGYNLTSADSSLVFIGETNDVSPDLVRLEWMRASGHPGQLVLNPGQLTLDPRGRTFYDRLRRDNVQLVLGVRISEGSRFDTTDFRARSAGQGGYERYAEELEGSGNFARVARLVVEAGRLEVTLWRVAPNARERFPGALAQWRQPGAATLAQPLSQRMSLFARDTP